MKRFVTYIYEYERGSRGRNVGFIRTDIRDSCCRMEIHIRGLDRFKGRCTVYLAVTDDSVGIPAAEILISQGSGFLKLTCQQNRIGNSGYLFSDLQAVVIRYGSGKVLAGCFVNEPSEKILRGDFTILGTNAEAVSENARPASAADSAAGSTTEAMPDTGDTPAEQKQNDNKPTPSVPDGTKNRTSPSVPSQTDSRTSPSVPEITDSRIFPSVPETNSSRTSPPVPEQDDNRTSPSAPETNGSRISPSVPEQPDNRTAPFVPDMTGDRTQPSATDAAGSGTSPSATEQPDNRTTLFATDTAGNRNGPVIPNMTDSRTAAPKQTDMTAAPIQPGMKTDTAPAGSATLRRIGITDIRSLPKCNWKLCNNSFLVHGFFNYHYLILKTVENGDTKQQFIGVPGIYEQPERMMALLFGFPEFEADENSPDMPSANATGTFGYWMCPLSAE